jgi:hypothetical protein
MKADYVNCKMHVSCTAAAAAARATNSITPLSYDNLQFDMHVSRMTKLANKAFEHFTLHWFHPYRLTQWVLDLFWRRQIKTNTFATFQHCL